MMRKLFCVPLAIVAAAVSLPLIAQDDKSGINSEGFDRSVRIQDDLYEHVNGSWLKSTKIPDDKSNYGSFTALQDRSQEQIKAIIEEAAKGKHEKGSNLQKVGDFYRSALNVELVNAKQMQPIEVEVNKIRKISSKAEFLKHCAHLQRMGVGNPFGFFVTADNKDSTRNLATVFQSGTTLPDRSYYLESGEKYETARNGLKTLAATYLKLSGSAAVENGPEEILNLQIELAKVQWERTRLRNPNARYNKYKVSDLAEFTPGIDWKMFLAECGAGEETEVNIATPSFFEGVEKLMESTSLDVWKVYLEFQLIDAYATVLSEEFVNAHFELHDKIIGGVPVQKKRDEIAVEMIGGRGAGDFGVLGEVVGKLYVERHFTPEAKARMDQLVKNLLEAYKQSINELPWMTDVTKAKAQEKLSKFTTKIGYTEKWRDYSKLEIDPEDLCGNIMRSASVEYQRMVDKLGKPVDRYEWGMTPQTVNAYYNPTKNEIVFPAAILQAPFFSMDADDAVNYGGIGAVIGHEISHGFDDSGSQFDGDGNLRNWWTDEDREAFKGLTTRLIKQYGNYEPLKDQKVNGQLTLGENIADLSGLSIAFKAYKISLGDKKSKMIAGWSGEQRFFLGWSQVWRRKYRDAEMVRRLLVDSHSPSRFRANGPVANLDAFHEAFQLKEGDKLFKPVKDRIRIW